MAKVKFGILSTAKIGIKSVIPALQKSEYCEVKGIASRTKEKAQKIADKFDIDKSYGLYEEILDDDEIDAIYIPLPNHLHIPWSIKALEAGKHVLCEKPIGLNTQEVQELQKVVDETDELKCMEAFMYRFHPQWEKVKGVINSAEVGQIQSIMSSFTYFNTNPEDIRNKYIEGGGGLMDIGCYCINLSRFLLNMEPDRVMANLNYDSEFGTDIQGNCILDFGDISAGFVCGTQQQDGQFVRIDGTKGRISIDKPFTPAEDYISVIQLETSENVEEIEITPADQYKLQVEEFAKSIIEDTPEPFSLEDALNNMKVIDALFESDKHDKWVVL